MTQDWKPGRGRWPAGYVKQWDELGGRTLSIEEFRAEVRTGPFWERLGIDGDLPTHLPISVTEDGQGPTDPDPAHHYECWCPDPQCPLTLAFQEAWQAGRRQGHDDAHRVIASMSNDSDWEGQAPSMGFAATLNQELTERPPQ